ncbi:MAG: sugar kinase [Candidatus Limivicinus sp.]|nr:sugar kinase [Clostridiales bacterium]MDY3859217.1 sugar kinase [Candidatus Limivicinus sp.]
MKKMVGFGDFMLRLNPEGYLRFIQADRFQVNYTGAEANVCVSLAMMGIETDFVTRLPDNAIAEAGVAQLRKFGVGVGHIAYGGERMGVFYAEKGASQRPSKIVYDRKYTSIATCSYDDFDWDAIFDGASNFHITGITPALSSTAPQVCAEACRKAKEMGLTVSCDLNYRKNLWSEAEAKACMTRLMPYIDVLVANEEDAEKVLGIKARDTDVTSGRLNRESYVDVADQICRIYGTQTVAVTLRRSISASDNEWSAMLYTGGRAYFSRKYMIHLVDRVGGGDSFSAGLLYGLMNGYTPQETVEYAAAASCLKQTIELDFNLSTHEEVEKLVAGDGSGRVQR